MLLKFDDPVSLTGARIESCRPLELTYGSQHTLEFECAYGANNDLINMQMRGCTRWTLALLKNLSTPTEPLLEETYEDNIAVGSRLYFTFAMTTMQLYKYVAGGEAMCVMVVKGYEDGEGVPSVSFQLPVYIKSSMTQKRPGVYNGTVNDATLTFMRNGQKVGEFSANSAVDKVIELSGDEDAFTGVRAIQVNGNYVTLTPSGTASIRVPKPIDHNTITDENGVLEVDGVLDANNQSKVTIWIGTRQEWIEQDKAASTDLCIITDDVEVVEEAYPAVQLVRTIPPGENSVNLSNGEIYEHAPTLHTLEYTLPATVSAGVRHHVQLAVLVQSAATSITFKTNDGAVCKALNPSGLMEQVPGVVVFELEYMHMLHRWSVTTRNI